MRGREGARGRGRGREGREASRERSRSVRVRGSSPAPQRRRLVFKESSPVRSRRSRSSSLSKKKQQQRAKNRKRNNNNNNNNSNHKHKHNRHHSTAKMKMKTKKSRSRSRSRSSSLSSTSSSSASSELSSGSSATTLSSASSLSTVDTSAKRKVRRRERLRARTAELKAKRQARWERSCVRWFWILGLPVILPCGVALYFMSRRARSAHEWITWNAYWDAFYVWLLHELGFRQDESGRDLFMALPGSTSLVLFPLKMWLRVARFFSRLWVEHKFYDAPPGRLHRRMSKLAFFDKAVARDEIEQVVILGGGLSTFGFNETFLGKHVHRVFEYNAKTINAGKRKLMRAAGIRARHVTSLNVRKGIGQKGRWLVDLTLAGFDPEATTLFIVNDDMWKWSPEAGKKFLAEVGDLVQGHPLHLLAFPYLDESLVRPPGWFSRKRQDAPTFGLPEGAQQAKWLRRVANLKPLDHARFPVEKTGFLLCTSPLNVPTA